MPDKLPEGRLPVSFRGISITLVASGGSWWLEVLPVPRNANERLRPPWRSVFRVPFLAIEGDLTYTAFIERIGTLALETYMKDTIELVPVT